jgi:phage-related minor tail protein
MSDEQTPIAAVFELQRRSIELSQEAMADGVEFQRRLGNALVDGVDTTETVQTRSVELTHDALDSYLDAVESTIPGSDEAVAEIRSTVDEQFDELEARQTDAFGKLEREAEAGADAYEELATESIQSLNEQLDAVLETHEEIETQTLEAFEEAEAQFDELRERLGDDDVASQFESQAEAFTEQFETQFEQFQTQLEEMAERVARRHSADN